MFPPEHQGNFLVTLVDKFADRYLRCNPECGFAKGVCFHILQTEYYFASDAQNYEIVSRNKLIYAKLFILSQ